MSHPDESPLDRLSELLADRALQGLPALEQAELARMLDTSQAEGLTWELAVAEASLALEYGSFEELPASLRDRVELDAEAILDRASFSVDRRSIRSRVGPYLGWVAAAALLLIIAGPRWAGRSPDRPLTARFEGLKPVKLTATDHPLARGAGGSLVWNFERQEGALTLDGLAEVQPTQGVYQLWIFDATRDERFPVDGGTFTISDASRATVVPIHPPLKVRQATLFAVTLEPPGGVVVSDRKRILLTGSLVDPADQTPR